MPLRCWPTIARQTTLEQATGKLEILHHHRVGRIYFSIYPCFPGFLFFSVSMLSAKSPIPIPFSPKLLRLHGWQHVYSSRLGDQAAGLAVLNYRVDHVDVVLVSHLYCMYAISQIPWDLTNTRNTRLMATTAP